MPLIKTKIEDSQAEDLLQSIYGKEVNDVIRIKAGEVSQAFAFVYSGENYILRVNIKDEGFLKDKYMADNCNSDLLPIPKIEKLGKFNDFVYSISAKAEGKTLDLHDEQTNRNLLPKLFATLNEIHTIEIKGNGISGCDMAILMQSIPTTILGRNLQLKPLTGMKLP